MDLPPLSVLGNGDRAQAVADANFILDTLIGQANSITETPTGATDPETGDPIMEPVEAGDPVSASGTFYATDMMKVWRYLVEESVSVSVPRNSFFADTKRMAWTQGTQPVAVEFNEATNTITVFTNKA